MTTCILCDNTGSYDAFDCDLHPFCYKCVDILNDISNIDDCPLHAPDTTLFVDINMGYAINYDGISILKSLRKYPFITNNICSYEKHVLNMVIASHHGISLNDMKTCDELLSLIDYLYDAKLEFEHVCDLIDELSDLFHSFRMVLRKMTMWECCKINTYEQYCNSSNDI